MRIKNYPVILIIILIFMAVPYGAFAQEENLVYIEEAEVTFENSEVNVSTLPLLISENYPCMEINTLAELIGASITDGKTLTKDNVCITYLEGEEIAGYSYKNRDEGRLILERKPVLYNGELYVPVSSLQATLGYYMHYNCFDKKLLIRTAQDYPEPQKIVYARDYGAVGDGICDDGPAITRAINAAVSSGVPSKVVLDADKVYLLGSRADNYGFFVLDEVENFTLDGQGSMLLFKTPTNNIMEITNSHNIKLVNLEVDYKELPFTQGVVVGVDAGTGTFTMLIEEGYPLPAADEWVKYYYRNSSNGGWWFTQIIDKEAPRPKYGVSEYDIFIDYVKNHTGRIYQVGVKPGQEYRLAEVEVGDRFVLNTRMSAYDVGDWTHNGLIHGTIRIYECGDVTIENFNMYAAPWNGINAGRNWGTLRLINFGEITKDGRIMAANSDGIHYWENRGALIMDGCHIMYTLDDQINTYAQSKKVFNIVDEYTFDIGSSKLIWEQGDEIVFMDADEHRVLGSAFLKNAENIGGENYRITVDRIINGIEAGEVSDTRNGTHIYNVNSSGKGSCIRDTRFEYGRRFAWLNRSPNSIFEYNTVYECGGSGVANTEEYLTGCWQGPIPSYFTMRNNDIDLPDQIRGEYPVMIHYITGGTVVSGEPADMKNVLLENNTIKSGRNSTAVRITSVDGIYMYNNTLASDMALDKGGNIAPILIENSVVGEIDGITFNYLFTDNIEEIVEFDGCQNTSAVKNINDISPTPIKNQITEK